MLKIALHTVMYGYQQQLSDAVPMTGTYYSIYILHLNYIYNGDNCFG